MNCDEPKSTKNPEIGFQISYAKGANRCEQKLSLAQRAGVCSQG